MGEEDKPLESGKYWEFDSSAGETYPGFQSEFPSNGFQYSGAEIAATQYNISDYSVLGTNTYMYYDFGTYLEETKREKIEDALCKLPGSFVIDNTPTKLEVRIFVSKNYTKLTQDYDSTKPASNEICIFLEDNTGDILSGRSYKVKVGSEYQRYLSLLKEGKDTSGFKRNSSTIETNEPGINPDFTQSEIQQLIETGELPEPQGWSLGDLVYIVNFVSIKLAPVYGWIGNEIIKVSNTVKGYIKFQEKHWNPAAERDDGSKFQPLLLSFLPDDGTIDTIISRFISKIEERRDRVIGYIDLLNSVDLSGLPSVFGTFGSAYNTIVKTIRKLIMSISTHIIDNLKSLMDVFAKIGSKVKNMINAYYCGIWNSLVDSVMGIVDVIGYIFKGLEFSGKAAASVDEILAVTKELIDEALQVAFETDWSAMFSSFITEAGEGIKSMFTSMGSFISISLEQVAFFVGAVAGFIIELILVVATGGTSLAALIPAKLALIFGSKAKVLSSIFSFLGKAITAIDTAMDVVASAILSPVFKVVQWLFSIIRKGAGEIAQIVRAFFRGLSKPSVLPDHTVLDVLRRMGIPNVDEVKRIFDAKGYQFIDEGNGRIVFKPNCG